MKFKRLVSKAFRFRCFSRRSNAAFLSLHREVTIGKVCREIADLELLKSGRKLAVVSLVWGTAAAYAADLQESDPLPEELADSLLTVQETALDADPAQVELQEVLVRSHRAEVQSEAFRLITRISGAELRQLPVQTLADVLAYLPGIDIRTRGANGGQADVSMRGGTFDQVLVMVNGVNLNDAQTGHYAMNLPLTPEVIDRIEVLQGTAASLFGLNAFSGAINIITRTPQPVDTLRVSTRLAGGMYGLANPALAVDWGRSEWTCRVGVEYTRNDGYEAPSPSEKEQTALKNSDLQKADVYALFAWRGLEMQVGAQYKDVGAGMFYGFGSQDQFDATRTAFGSIRHQWTKGKWGGQTLASYRANYDRYEWHRGQRLYGNFHFLQTAAVSAKAYYCWRLGKTSAGVELRNENLSSTNLGDTIRPNGQVPNVEGFDLKDLRVLRLVKGVNRMHANFFAEQSFLFGPFTASAGLSGNYNTMTGLNWSGGVNMGYAYGAQSSVYVNANRSLRLPVFTDLYYNAGNQLGNRDLRPEEAWLLSVGTKYNCPLRGRQQLRLTADAYYRFGRNIIDWVYVAGDAKRPFHAANHEKVDATGVEVAACYRLNDWLPRVSLSYAYTFMDLDLAASGSRYLDYLSHKAVLGVDHAIWRKTSGSSLWQRWEIGAVWQLSFKKREGEYNDAEGTVQSYRPVWLLDGSVYWKNDRLKVSASCTNMTNRRYYDYGGVLQPGAWAKVSASYVW